jgi:hypothetical protein
MEKAVPVIYDGVSIDNFTAKIVLQTLQENWTINLLEVMRIQSYLQKNLESFAGIQKTQVLEDKLLLFSSVA